MSLLVFDTPEMYAPLARVSPWLDMNTRPLADVVAELEAQTHRRFIKSHLPYDSLPHDDRVTYITVGRDPRDVGVSWLHHEDNIDPEHFLAEILASVSIDDLGQLDAEDMPDMSGTLAERFWRWVDKPGIVSSLNGVVHHLRSFWDHRAAPNVVLLHYADLQRDLVGQMQSLAGRLGIEVSRARLVELAPFASFDEMKQSAERHAPNGDQTFWKSTSEFFRSGRGGEWRALVSDDDLRRYDKRIGELADQEFADWLHQGTLG